MRDLTLDVTRGVTPDVTRDMGVTIARDAIFPVTRAQVRIAFDCRRIDVAVETAEVVNAKERHADAAHGVRVPLVPPWLTPMSAV